MPVRVHVLFCLLALLACLVKGGEAPFPPPKSNMIHPRFFLCPRVTVRRYYQELVQGSDDNAGGMVKLPTDLALLNVRRKGGRGAAMIETLVVDTVAPPLRTQTF